MAFASLHRYASIIRLHKGLEFSSRKFTSDQQTGGSSNRCLPTGLRVILANSSQSRAPHGTKCLTSTDSSRWHAGAGLKTQSLSHERSSSLISSAGLAKICTDFLASLAIGLPLINLDISSTSTSHQPRHLINLDISSTSTSHQPRHLINPFTNLLQGNSLPFLLDHAS